MEDGSFEAEAIAMGGRPERASQIWRALEREATTALGALSIEAVADNPEIGDTIVDEQTNHTNRPASQ